VHSLRKFYHSGKIRARVPSIAGIRKKWAQTDNVLISAKYSVRL
jgi:hypothetical protein